VETAHVYETGVSETAWDEAYLTAYPEVYRGLVALGARPDEAEDALHDAFVRGLEGAHVSRAAGWLFVVSPAPLASSPVPRADLQPAPGGHALCTRDRARAPDRPL
jgi:hypothetical protein